MQNKLTLPVTASYLLAGIAAVVVLKAGLLLALFSGLLVYSIVHILTPVIEKKVRFFKARILILALLAVIVITGLTMLVISGYEFVE